MKKIIIVLLVFTIPVLTQAQETPFKKEYKPQLGLSLIGGTLQKEKFRLELF